ncbi:Bis(5'-nucleosyl)-tetraphosphatase [symmetrical] [Buchnera aphidicola (Eriosoma grossulariae)]|uniref:symmetrical bis(5'-nucleosyl)-tetraphosphatase n=1 Tax=Buchnera aphidicola TaxID=9 RepID=UPI0034644F92
MSTYFVGDVHGCFYQLQNLLKKVNFNIKQDIIWFTGDLVARGPDSLNVIKLIYSLGIHARVVLGNHDLNLLAVHAGIRKYQISDNFIDLLESSDIDIFINWLRNCPILIVDQNKKILMSHAGIFPYWNISTAIKYANKIEKQLIGPNYIDFLSNIYGDFPDSWNSQLNEIDQLRFSMNVFTRMRYCLMNGKLDFSCKSAPKLKLKNLIPWFLMKNQLFLEDYTVIFGHWSTLRGFKTPKNIISLDTGCCWGNELSMLRWEDQIYFKESFYH